MPIAPRRVLVFRPSHVLKAVINKIKRRSTAKTRIDLDRVNVMMGALRRQRRLVEAAQDELEFSRISVDVADREIAGMVGLELFGVDGNEVFVKVSGPSRRPGRASW